jgi:formyl-CoA transferase
MITAWTSQHDKYDVMRMLGEAKIPVGAVRDTRELMDDPDFERRGVMQHIDHPELGPFKMVGWPVRHDGKTSRLKPAPLVGENTEEIFSSWLNLDAAEIEKLRKDKVV